MAADCKIERRVAEGKGGQVRGPVRRRVEHVDRDITQRGIRGQNFVNALLRRDMEQPEPSLHQPMPVAQMHPHEAMTLQRAATRTARIAPAIEPEGKKSAVSPAANRAGESAAGNSRIRGFPHVLPHPIDSIRRDIRRPYLAQHPVQVLQMAGKENDNGNEPGTGVVVRSRTKTKKPSMYKVLMLNDDYTPMEFVVDVLERFFGKNIEEATRIMWHVHRRGVGICGVYTYEVAETKVNLVMDFAQENGHPLQCTLEKE
jgi:ATP-dependent Clp protease adaptor protein ClpS